jgi:hypothetical protein
VGHVILKNLIPSARLLYPFERRPAIADRPFPSWLLGETTSYEFSRIVMYLAKISEKWSTFHQLLFATNLTTRNLSHSYSFQQKRVGLDYKQTIQFGLGSDFNFIGEGEGCHYSRNIGIFVRVRP